MAVPAPGRDDFADLLPPVGYQQPAVPGQAPARPPAGRAGSRAAAAGQRAATALPGPARSLMVLATMLGLIGLAVLLPLAGAVAALGALVLLRAADLTGKRLVRRRTGPAARPADAVSAAFYYPWAMVRTVLRFVLLSPMALLFALAAAVLTVLATGQAGLPRVPSFAAGALVACYCLGPGSAACRRPLGRFYGRVLRSAPAGVIGSVGLAAIAVAVLAAALTSAPGYWPAVHLGNELQAAATASHPTLSNVTNVGLRLVHWIERF
jgi:hypothetical protein